MLKIYKLYKFTEINRIARLNFRPINVLSNLPTSGNTL